jgi:hypothetical protein
LHSTNTGRAPVRCIASAALSATATASLGRDEDGKDHVALPDEAFEVAGVLEAGGGGSLARKLAAPFERRQHLKIR